MRPQPLLVVKDVPAASRFYQQLLGLVSDHGGEEYERLVHGRKLVMQLHAWEITHDHGAIGDPALPVGNGALLWIEVDDFDAVVARARRMEAKILRGPVRNPEDGSGGPDHRELWLRDLDGYVVVVASPDGEASRALAKRRRRVKKPRVKKPRVQKQRVTKRPAKNAAARKRPARVA